MPNYHPYLISSLPYLQFGMKAPIDFKRFLELCYGLIPEEDLEILKKYADVTKEQQKPYAKSKPIVKAWRDFEFMLRNELVKVRAKRLHKDSASYLRGSLDAELSYVHKISEIIRQSNPLEAERLLDLMRWSKLDELSFSHFFDIEFLFIYAQKLLILERWDKISSSDRQKLLSNVLKTVEHS